MPSCPLHIRMLPPEVDGLVVQLVVSHGDALASFDGSQWKTVRDFVRSCADSAQGQTSMQWVSDARRRWTQLASKRPACSAPESVQCAQFTRNVVQAEAFHHHLTRPPVRLRLQLKRAAPRDPPPHHQQQVWLWVTLAPHRKCSGGRSRLLGTAAFAG